MRHQWVAARPIGACFSRERTDLGVSGVDQCYHRRLDVEAYMNENPHFTHKRRKRMGVRTKPNNSSPKQQHRNTPIPTTHQMATAMTPRYLNHPPAILGRIFHQVREQLVQAPRVAHPVHLRHIPTTKAWSRSRLAASTNRCLGVAVLSARKRDGGDQRHTWGCRASDFSCISGSSSSSSSSSRCTGGGGEYEATPGNSGSRSRSNRGCIGCATYWGDRRRRAFLPARTKG